MNVIVSNSVLTGNLTIVSSKSLLHRYILMASLMDTPVTLTNVDLSKDILCTIEAFRKIGKNIVFHETNKSLTIRGKIEIKPDYEIYVGESGSTLRFLIPVFIALFGSIRFYGAPSLMKRPMDSYFPIFEENGIEFERTEEWISLRGQFKKKQFLLDGSISSQFLTGMLFTSSLIEGKKEIFMTNELESKNYIDLTLQVMQHFGLSVQNNGYKSFIIDGIVQKNNIIDRPIAIEPDFSQCAYFLVAGALQGPIKIDQIDYHHSLQGDKIIVDYLNRAGAEVEVLNTSIFVKYNSLKRMRFDLKNCPDLGPILFVHSLFSDGPTLFYNIKRLRYKESDRIEAMLQNFQKIGVSYVEKENCLLIKPIDRSICFDEKIVFDSFNDHRIAISLAILASRLKGTFEIRQFEAIEKSYPGFIRDFKAMGGIILEQ